METFDITNITIHGKGDLPAGSIVLVTVLDQTFQAWVRDAHYEADWPEGQRYRFTIQWFDIERHNAAINAVAGVDEPF